MPAVFVVRAILLSSNAIFSLLLASAIATVGQRVLNAPLMRKARLHDLKVL